MKLDQIKYTFMEFWEHRQACDIISFIWELEDYDVELAKIINWDKTINDNIHAVTGSHLEINTDNQVFYNKDKYKHDLVFLLRTISKKVKFSDEEQNNYKGIL